MVVQKQIIHERRSLIFLSNGHLQMNEINQWWHWILVEWSCTNKINELMKTLGFGRMVVYK